MKILTIVSLSTCAGGCYLAYKCNNYADRVNLCNNKLKIINAVKYDLKDVNRKLIK